MGQTISEISLYFRYEEYAENIIFAIWAPILESEGAY